MINLFDILASLYEKLPLSAERSFRKIEEIGDFKNSDVIIDIGGGTGRIAKFLANKVKSITVIDPSQKMIKLCKKHSGFSCILGEGENLPFENNSIDKVILVDAFHHIRQQVKAIQEITRVLKKGGLAIIEEFNPSTFGGKFIKITENIFGFKSVFYKPSELEKLFLDCGFKVETIDSGKKNYYIIAQKNYENNEKNPDPDLS